MLDSDAVGEALERLAAGQSVDGRPVVVRRIARLADAPEAGVLYVPGPSKRIAEAVRALGSRPVLVVADDPDGLDAGATISFVIIGSRVRFEVSLPAASRAGLTLRAPLLAVAHRVEGAPARPVDTGGTPTPTAAAMPDGAPEYSLRGY